MTSKKGTGQPRTMLPVHQDAALPLYALKPSVTPAAVVTAENLPYIATLPICLAVGTHLQGSDIVTPMKA